VVRVPPAGRLGDSVDQHAEAPDEPVRARPGHELGAEGRDLREGAGRRFAQRCRERVLLLGELGASVQLRLHFRGECARWGGSELVTQCQRLSAVLVCLVGATRLFERNSQLGQGAGPPPACGHLGEQVEGAPQAADGAVGAPPFVGLPLRGTRPPGRARVARSR
jgi:hypothetical protein